MPVAVQQIHLVIRNPLADTQQHELAAACKSSRRDHCFPRAS
jgi:hypothetical protein